MITGTTARYILSLPLTRVKGADYVRKFYLLQSDKIVFR